MKLPSKRSRAAIVLDFLARESNTLQQGIARHTDFGISMAKIRIIYEGLVTSGCATTVNGIYTITTEARRALAAPEHQEPVEAAQEVPVVGARYTREFRPMKSNRPRLQEMREGAFDYRDVPSRIGATSVPFASSVVLVEDGDGHA